MSANFNIMGIYKIINKENGKFYIGSSVNISKRWNKHILDLNTNKHHNKHLQRAWDKYGGDSFEFQLIEVVNDFNMLEDAEQRWINNTNCCLPEIGYNISNCVDRPSINGNKSLISMVRTDMQKLLLDKKISKNEGHMLFVLSAFLSKYDNSVKIKYKYPQADEIKSIAGFGNNVYYATLKTLEDKNLIRRSCNNAGNIIYLNPNYIRYGEYIDRSIYDLFDNKG